MANPLEDENWVRGLGNELTEHLRRADKEWDRAEQRHRDLVQTHRDGWKSTADAILRGFGLLADAVRDHGRR